MTPQVALHGGRARRPSGLPDERGRARARPPFGGGHGDEDWPFGVFAQVKGGLAIEYRDLQTGLKPVRKIRREA
jgi:hypothetical protein